MANLLPRNPDGTLASYASATDAQPRGEHGYWVEQPPATVIALKTRVLEELARGKSLKQAMEAAGTNAMTLWRLRRRDPELNELIEDWLHSAGFEAGLTMQEAVREPEKFEAGLKYASWANFNMIMAKAAFPQLRDNFQININNTTQIAVGDWQGAIQAEYARRQSEEEPQ